MYQIELSHKSVTAVLETGAVGLVCGFAMFAITLAYSVMRHPCAKEAPTCFMVGVGILTPLAAVCGGLFYRYVDIVWVP